MPALTRKREREAGVAEVDGAIAEADGAIAEADDATAEADGAIAKADDAIAKAKDELATLFTAHGVDDSHGLGHALAVLNHAEAALAAAHPQVPAGRRLSVRLAALLHDADDRKYFPASVGHANAAKIAAGAVAHAGCDGGEAVVTDMLRMIDLVSCSANGNSAPAEARSQPELLWPRWADRLEAAGEIGVARCFKYNTKVGAPLACEGVTPRPKSAAEALALATEERFAQYQVSGGSSASMLDHYYDKLLQVARPPAELVQNAYLEEEARKRADPLLEVLLAYGETGRVPVECIEAMCVRVGLCT